MTGWPLLVTGPVAAAFSNSPTMLAQGASSVVSFPANSPEYVIETVVAERDKWQLEMQKNRVYSALVQAQWSCLQMLSTQTLLWASFIQHRLSGL